MTRAIYKDNQEQKIAFFSKKVTLPLTLGLLIDTSGSGRNRLGAEQEAGIGFLERVGHHRKILAAVLARQSAVIQGRQGR